MNNDCILNATQLIISQSDILINICFVNDPSLNDGDRWISRTMFILPTTLINVGIKATNLPGSKDTSKKVDMIQSARMCCGMRYTIGVLLIQRGKRILEQNS